MRLLARVVAVLVAAVLYSIVFLLAAVGTWAAATWNEPNGTTEFFAALDRARAAGAADECGYVQAGSAKKIHLSHADIVGMSGCFARRGYLTSSGLHVIETDPFEYTYYRAYGRTVGGTTTAWTVQQGSVPRWVKVLWLAGLGAVIWIVGFRLLWRRPRTA